VSGGGGSCGGLGELKGATSAGATPGEAPMFAVVGVGMSVGVGAGAAAAFIDAVDIWDVEAPGAAESGPAGAGDAEGFVFGFGLA
jgi:hypothetical protein